MVYWGIRRLGIGIRESGDSHSNVKKIREFSLQPQKLLKLQKPQKPQKPQKLKMTHFYTITDDAYGEYREKGSKFLAYAHPVETEEAVKDWVGVYRKEHPKARHWCYAYRLDTEGKVFRANDDGEPSGTAGKPILGQIDSNNLSKVVVIVVRYFGGKKLGASGLITAYKTATAEALAQAKIIEVKIRSYYEVTFAYGRMNDLMRFLKHDDLKIIEQSYDTLCKLKFSIPIAEEESILNKLEKLYDITTKHLYTE